MLRYCCVIVIPQEDLNTFSTDTTVSLSFSNSIAVTHNTSTSCDGIVKDIEPVEREGTLHVKFTVLDGKVRYNV